MKFDYHKVSQFGNKYLYSIKLCPQTQLETYLLEENNDTAMIEAYYHQGVSRCLGLDANLLQIVDEKNWPYEASVEVGFSKCME